MRTLVAVLCLALCGVCGILAWLASVSIRTSGAVGPRAGESRELTSALHAVAAELGEVGTGLRDLARELDEHEPEREDVREPPAPRPGPVRTEIGRARTFGTRPRARPPEPGPHLVETFDDGTKSCEGYRIQDATGEWILHGDWVAWHENGEIYEQGSYFHGAEEGRWTWWHENGARMAEGAFRAGEREGPWTFWYPNGARQMEGRYVHGKAEGVWTSWHENGRSWVEGEQKGGEAHGRWQVYLADGSVDRERSGVYASGERIGD